jgi:hypothetical protein
VVDATDATLAVAGLGLLTAIVTVIYTHINTQQTRRMMMASIQQTTLSNHAELLERSFRARAVALRNPHIREDLVARFAGMREVLAMAGDVETFIAYRDAMDAAMDLYFLRKEGVLADEYWMVWSHAQPRIYAQLQSYQAAFRFAAKAQWIHPEFVRAYEPLFSGGDFQDPKGIRA